MIKINNYAIFGGTFDPIHNGHLHLINSLLSIKRFEKLIVVPAGDPWQKQPNVSAKSRVEMVRLALSGQDVEISEIEINRSGPSYAIDTVSELKGQYPNKNFTWILGSDAFAEIGSWHRINDLAKLVDFLVIERPGGPVVKVNSDLSYQSLEISALDISSSEIRKRISEHENYENLLPASVADYIREHRLYGAA